MDAIDDELAAETPPETRIEHLHDGAPPAEPFKLPTLYTAPMAQPAPQAIQPTPGPRVPPNKGGRPAGVRDVTPRQGRGTPAIPAAIAAAPAMGLSIPPFPLPKHNLLQPVDFMEYWGTCEQGYPGRATVYVYRGWPVCDREAHGLTNNIDKIVLSADSKFNFKHFQDELLKRYGSGDYKLMLNAHDTVLGRDRNYTSTRVNNLRDKDYPPMLDYNHLDLADKSNASYIAGLKQKGLLTVDGKPAGGQSTTQPKEEDMSTASAALLDRTLNMTEQQITNANARADRAEQENRELHNRLAAIEARLSAAPANNQASTADATRQVLDVFTESVKRGQQMLADTSARDAEVRGKMSDPFIMMGELAKLVEVMKGGGGSGADGMVAQLMQIVLTQSTAHATEMAQMQTKMMEIALGAKSGSGPKPITETVSEIMAIRQAFGDTGQPQATGGAQDDGDGDGDYARPSRKEPWYVQMMPMLLPMLLPLLQRIASPQPSYPPPGYPMQPGQYPPNALPQGQWPSQPTPGAAPQYPAPPVPQRPQMPSTNGGFQQLHELINYFTEPILRSLNAREHGSIFADWVIGGYGLNEFEQFRSVGHQAMMNAATTNPAFWGRIGAMGQHFDRWLGEVLAYDPNLADDGEDDLDTTAAQATPAAVGYTARPAGVPASATPTGSYGNDVLRMMGPS